MTGLFLLMQGTSIFANEPEHKPLHLTVNPMLRFNPESKYGHIMFFEIREEMEFTQDSKHWIKPHSCKVLTFGKPKDGGFNAHMIFCEDDKMKLLLKREVTGKVLGTVDQLNQGMVLPVTLLGLESLRNISPSQSNLMQP